MRSGGLRGQEGRAGHEAYSLTSLHVQLTLKRWRGNEHRSERISEDVGEKLSVAHSEKKMPQVWKQGFLWGCCCSAASGRDRGPGKDTWFKLTVTLHHLGVGTTGPPDPDLPATWRVLTLGHFPLKILPGSRVSIPHRAVRPQA